MFAVWDLFSKELRNVNPNHLGRLIGRSGSRLNEIKSKFSNDLEIKIRRENATNAVIKLTASDEKTIDDCGRLIQFLIDEIDARGRLDQFSVATNYERLKNTLFSRSLHVPVEHFGRLIGKNGNRVNKIQDEFNVKIHFLNDENYNDNVKVTSFDLRACQAAIIELSNLSRSFTSRMEENSVQNEKADICNSSIYIPDEYLTLMSNGNQDKMLTKIEEKYNVVIHVDNDCDKNNVIVESASVRKCQRAIDELSRVYQSNKALARQRTIERVEDLLKTRKYSRKHMKEYLQEEQSFGEIETEIDDDDDDGDFYF